MAMKTNVNPSPELEVVKLSIDAIPTINSITTESTKDSINESEDILLQTPSSPSTSEPSLPFSVPPTTPHPRYSFCYVIDSIPSHFPDLSSLKLPYIREVGIKDAIEILSKHFNCPNYKCNAVQFWFLDVLTDCLWKMQDEYQFPEKYQKIVLEWVLYVFDLIRDPRRNLSKNEFFRIFNESVAIANERVQSGCDTLPSPQDLVTLLEEVGDEEISFSSLSEQPSTFSSLSNESFLAVGMDESVEIFQLPKTPLKCFKKNQSSIDLVEENEESECGCEEAIEFYQPDLNTPERFKSPLTSESISDEELQPAEQTFLWKPSSESFKGICPEAKDSTTTENSIQPEDNIRQEWQNYLEDRKEYVEELDRKIMINTCVLSVMKEFVYDYFHETFQYTIVKLALMNRFNSITQAINSDWNIPKVLKEELKKPKEKKEKKPKSKKEKKQKPKKPQAKKPKKPKDKKPKKPKKEKPKKKVLTKEEKEELARLKREQERLEEEMRIAEENRRLLFPLKEATDDEFFKSIFDKWVKPKEDKKRGKK